MRHCRPSVDGVGSTLLRS